MKPVRYRSALPILAVLAMLASPFTDVRAEVADRATSQTLYVPSYSRVLTQEERSQPLASTLVVHNIDPNQEITITSIAYYDRNGAMLKTFTDAEVSLRPFASTSALMPLGGIGDGIGANFIVTWSSARPALPPVVEAVMIGGDGTQGISFTSQGTVISQAP